VETSTTAAHRLNTVVMNTKFLQLPLPAMIKITLKINGSAPKMKWFVASETSHRSKNL